MQDNIFSYVYLNFIAIFRTTNFQLDWTWLPKNDTSRKYCAWQHCLFILVFILVEAHTIQHLQYTTHTSHRAPSFFICVNGTFSSSIPKIPTAPHPFTVGRQSPYFFWGGQAMHLLSQGEGIKV